MLRKNLLISLLLLPVAYSAMAEDIVCKYEKRFKGSGFKQADLKVRINENVITHLAVSSSYASGKEGGGYVCEVDTAEPDQIVKWDTKKGRTLLQVTFAGARPSNIEIESTQKGYRVNLEGASLDACGFGAEWPRSIEVSRGSKKCEVIYDNF